MKPGHKISLTYSTITILLVLVSSAVFYFGTRHYISSLYYNYLEEKARVLAMERYGQDDLDPVKYRNAVQRSQHAIPTSRELFVPKDSIETALSSLLTGSQIASLLRGEVVHFDHEGEVGTALLYYDNSGTFASVVLSRNPYGDEIAHTMRLLLVVFVLGASLLLWLVSRLWASRMVNRIDQNYQTEKMFVNNAQHEINNPLAVISGECDVTLLRDRSPEEYRSALMRIAKQVDRINGIIIQLLAIDDARNRPQKAESIDLSEWFFQNELPPHKLYIHGSFRVKMDPDALYIAISNLIGNAVKYGDGSSVVVHAEYPTVSVTNHGSPIPAEELEHIFDPFYRAANADGIPGHGIGLALAHTLLQRNGAQLTVTSSSENTIFTIRFSK